MTTTTAVARQDSKTLVDLLKSDTMKKRFAEVLPTICTPERFMRFALLAVNKVPKLQDCDQNSVIAAMMDCASMGIEPDGRLAHLIPFGKTVQLIVDWKGYVALARRAKIVRNWTAEVVNRNDKFRWVNGQISHEIDFMSERGEPIGVYSHIITADGVDDYEFLSAEQVEAVRKASRAGDSGPWSHESFKFEMWRKSAIKRHAKRYQGLSAELDMALDRDDDKLKDVTAEVEIGPARAAAALSAKKDAATSAAPDADIEPATDGNQHDALIAEIRKIMDGAPGGVIKRALGELNKSYPGDVAVTAETWPNMEPDAKLSEFKALLIV